MERFRVVIFFPDETWFEEGSNLTAEEAVTLSKRITERPAVALGVIARVIVTDADDFIVLEWKNGQGVTFPPRESR